MRVSRIRGRFFDRRSLTQPTQLSLYTIIRPEIRRPAKLTTVSRGAWPKPPSFCKLNCWITSSSVRHRTPLLVISVSKRQECYDGEISKHAICVAIFRLSPCSRGEVQGEGFERTRFESILTLPLSFKQGEATPFARCRTNLLRQT